MRQLYYNKHQIHVYFNCECKYHEYQIDPRDLIIKSYHVSGLILTDFASRNVTMNMSNKD